MDESEIDLRDGSPETLTRRDLVWLAAIIPLGGGFLVGCGGSGSKTGAPPVAGTVRVSVVVTLPKGSPTANLVGVSGAAESPVKGGKFQAQVDKAGLTLVSVVDLASKRLLTLGMADPSSSTLALDFKNMAATLVFVAAGGWQGRHAQRKPLWTNIFTHPATATLAATLESRLDLDPFGLFKGDAQIKAAIATAIGSMSFLNASKGQQVGGATSIGANGPALPPRADPSTCLVLGQEGQVEMRKVQLRNGRTDPSSPPDLPDTAATNSEELTEFTFLAFQIDTVGNRRAKRLVGPPALVSDFGHFGSLLMELENPTDLSNVVRLVRAFPLFDAPDPVLLADPVFAGQAAYLRSQMANIWERTAAGLAARFIIDALGHGGVEWQPAALTQAIASLKGIGANVKAKVEEARAGTGLQSKVEGITALASSSDANAQAFIGALTPLAPNTLAHASAARLLQMNGLLTVANLANLGTLANLYGPISATCVPGLFDPDNATLLASVELGLYRVRIELVPSAATYKPGGTPVKFTANVFPVGQYVEKFADTLIFHWKLFGAGEAHLSDGKGKSGLEFDSKATSVTLTTKASANGLQTVGLEIFSTAGGDRHSIVKETLGINTAAQNVYKLTRPTLLVQPNRSAGWLIADKNGSTDMSRWTGVNVANLRFQWDLGSTQFGELSNGTSTGASFETSVNSIQFNAKAQVKDLSYAQLTCTIKLVDPATGHFTNLATLHGEAQIDVLDGAQWQIGSHDFPLTDFFNPDPIHNYRQLVQTRGTDANGAFMNVSTNVGERDFINIRLRKFENLQVNDVLDIDTDGSDLSVTHVNADLYLKARGLNSTITAVKANVFGVHREAGKVDYVKLNLALTNHVEFTNATWTSSVIVGIGRNPVDF